MNFLSNLFPKSSESRGLPDNEIHGGNLQPNEASGSTQLPVSAPPSQEAPLLTPTPTSAPGPSYPTGYPNANNYPPHAHQPPTGYPYGYQTGPWQSNGYPNFNTYPPPPTGYPYGPQTGPVWNFETGNNKSLKGTQEGGNIKVANNAAGPGSSVPQTGHFSFSTGGNFNQGEVQKIGNIEFSNVSVDYPQKRVD